MTMRTLYIECNMGAAGDMLMSALYELLEEEQKKQFLEKMNHLGIDGLSIEPKRVQKCGIYGTHMSVLIDGQEEQEHSHGESGHHHEHSHSHGESGHHHDHSHSHEELGHHHDHSHSHEESGHHHEHSHSHEGLGHDYDHGHNHGEFEHQHSHTGHHHYTYQMIVDKVDQFDLQQRVKDKIKEIYRLIAQAESEAHEAPIEQIHFHEVGSLDAIADVTGCSLLMELLQIEKVIVSPIHVGNGTVCCAHGVLPVPAPATAHILKEVPFYTGTIMTELCTPTGAAVLKAYANEFGSMPIMKVEKIGYGMGQKEFEVANCVRVFLGEVEPNKKDRESLKEKERIVEICCNLDDMTPEAIGYVMDMLLEEGALDVFTTPIMMKKNRPATMLTCLCSTEISDHMIQKILEETTTIGVRYVNYERKTLESTFENIETEWGKIRMKISEGHGIKKEKPEYEDVRRIAKEQGISFQKVLESILKERK